LLIKELFVKGKAKQGYRTITMNLGTEKKVVMNHKKVLRIMNEYGLITKIRRRNPYRDIMKKSMEHRTCDNILAREFKQVTPQRVLCTDITYLWFGQRFVYLSAVKDIASREIVAWSLSWHLGMSLVFDTVKDLKHNSKMQNWPLENVLLHSDQGFHYTNPDYIQEIKELKMRQSMSRKGNCIDNSPMESFFGHLKDEVDYKEVKSFDELREIISNYISYYNNHRQQWELKKMTPVQYRNHLLSVH
jgi:putative transposase